MKILTLCCAGLFIVSMLSGCAFLGGTAVGAAGAGAGYEIQAARQMDQLEEDYKSEQISRETYEARKEQTESGSIIY